MPAKQNKNINKYLKYSGIGFTLFALLGLAVFAGQKVDEYLNLEQPWFTILFIVVAFVGWVVKLIRDLAADDKVD